ncbi:MAG: beta-galactosidase [Oscillospiraceae bacterium]|nr:beta-galactosidase [Oscillospiraceae bacterium]
METLLHRAFLHGGDYNPDQWLDRPEILKKDIALMKQAHVNCVSLGIFAWSTLEPQEGVYRFEWLKQVIDTLYENGIYTVLSTPSGARQVWMAHEYPEVLRVDETLHRNHMGGRHNHCYTSPVYRRLVWEMDTRLARAFGQHPGVLMWHISNEFGGACYCPLCQQAFREWLQEKYKTLQNLNRQWWASFWSHTYTDWQQIEAPGPRGEEMLHGLSLDWKRFVTARTVDFCAWEKKAIRAGGSDLPVTTNLIGLYNGLDYTKFRDVLDIYSWDNYPAWRCGESDTKVAIDTAFTHDFVRGMQRKPYLMMESSPSRVNWRQINPLRAPGMHEFTSLQAVAHGSDSVQYFQWRQSRGASEKFHGAVVDHYGENDTRVFGEVSGVGQRLQKLAPLCGSELHPQAAVLYDRENRWAVDAACGPRNNGTMHYDATAVAHYQAFWRLGIDADVVCEDDDLSGYRLVIAPILYLHRAGIAEKLRRFVAAGGTLVGTYWSGLVNENDLCFEGATPGEGLSEVYGLRTEETDALYDGRQNHMTWNNKRYALREICELVKPLGAKTLSVYDEDFYAGMPALTVHPYGKGTAYFQAALAEDAFYQDFYRELTQKLGIRPALGATQLPQGVTAGCREKDGQRFLFVQNSTDTAVSFALDTPRRSFETGETLSQVSLAPYGTAVLTEPAGK